MTPRAILNNADRPGPPGSPAGTVFCAFFQQLEREGIPAVVLHSYAHFPDVVKSDVDYAVPHAALAELPRIERTVAEQCGWVVAQRFEHETTACSAILANPQRPGETIMLDAASHYARNGCVFLPDTDLLEGRQSHGDFFIPHPAAEFIYIWTKIFAKGKQAEPNLPRLRELYQAAPERSELLFARLFGPELGLARDWLNRPVDKWAELDRALHQRSRFTLAQHVGNAARLLRRLRHPTGLTIAFLGPDGTGKSTVIARVSELLRPCFRRQLAIHFNPRFGAPSAAPPVTDPQACPPRSAPTSWAKILFYFARHWAHWLLIQTPARVRSTLIIYDRTFIDLLVDPRRYRVQRSAWLVAALARCLPPPDLTFILDAPAAVIHQRKSELRPEEIERQRAALRPLAQDSARVTIVSTEATPDAVSATVARHVITLLASRQARRS